MPSSADACAIVAPGAVRQRTISSRSGTWSLVGPLLADAGEHLGWQVLHVDHIRTGGDAHDLAQLPGVLRPRDPDTLKRSFGL